MRSRLVHGLATNHDSASCPLLRADHENQLEVGVGREVRVHVAVLLDAKLSKCDGDGE